MKCFNNNNSKNNNKILSKSSSSSFLYYNTLILFALVFVYQQESCNGFSFVRTTTSLRIPSSLSKSTTTTTTTTSKVSSNHHNNRAISLSSLSSSSSSQLNAATSLPLPDKNIASSSLVDETKLQIVQDDNIKVGILLLNLGGPETGDDVEGFLYNLFADPDIIRLPGPLTSLQNPIAYFISKRRAPKSRAAYESIGGGSPILKYSNEQAQLLCNKLQEKYNLNVNAYIGMRYWKPFTEDALEQIQNDNIEALIIIPLYPQFSISTSGSSLRVLQEEFSKNSIKYKDMIHTVIPSWYNRKGYINAMANLIEKELLSFTNKQIEYAKYIKPKQQPLHVLFSAHGVPQSYIEAGDPYQKQIQECVIEISKELLSRSTLTNTTTNSIKQLVNIDTINNNNKFNNNGGSDNDNNDAKNIVPTTIIENDIIQIHLSYQSRVGPIEWLRPYTDDVLPELGLERIVKNLVVVPISFVSEHIETLEEIDIEYRELAEESGIKNWRRCPALNTDNDFIEDMADMVYDALLQPSQSVTEAIISNNVGNVDLLNDMDSTSIGVAGIGGVGATGDLFTTTTTATTTTSSSSSSGADNIKSSSSSSSSSSLMETERINARVAMAGVLFTILLEAALGHPFTQLFGGTK